VQHAASTATSQDELNQKSPLTSTTSSADSQTSLYTLFLLIISLLCCYDSNMLMLSICFVTCTA